MCLSGLGTAPKASPLHGARAAVTLPLCTMQSKGRAITGEAVGVPPSPQGRYRSMAAPDMDVKVGKIYSASLQGAAAAASLCSGCLLCTCPAAALN